MWQIGITSDDKTITVLLGDDQLVDIEQTLSEDQLQTILKKLATKLFDRLLVDDSVNKIQNENNAPYHIFLNSVHISDINNLKARIHYAEKNKHHEVSKPTILELDLQNVIIPDDYKLSIVHFVDEIEPLDKAFKKIFDSTALQEWFSDASTSLRIKKLMDTLSAPPIAEYDIQPVTFSLASGVTHKETIPYLSAYLKLKADDLATAQHFIPGTNNTLINELLPIVHQQRNTQYFIDLIAKKVGHKDEQQEALGKYVAKERERLLLAMRIIKEERVKGIFAEKNESYEKCLSAAWPNEYKELENTYHYIKKNIIIALYNAARDYYKQIWESRNKDKFALKLVNFNEKFAGIAQIDLRTLEMSPIEEAFANTSEMELIHENHDKSLEVMVDKLVKRCAHINGYPQYGDTFKCVKLRLNAFNDAQYIDPLEKDKTRPGQFFIPVNAPGEASTLGSISRKLPLGSRAGDLIGGLGSMLWDQNEFAFNKRTKDLINAITPAKEKFREQLLTVRQCVDDIKKIVQTGVMCDEEALGYDGANNNIRAFADLLRRKISILDHIESSLATIQQLIRNIAPAREAKSKFIHLARDYGLKANEISELAQCTFNEDSINLFTPLISNLNEFQKTLANEKAAFASLIQQAINKDTLIDNTGVCLHNRDIDEITKRLHTLDGEISAIATEINLIHASLRNASLLIQSFETIKVTNGLIHQFRLSHLNTRLNQPTDRFDGLNILVPAIRFYSEAQKHFNELTTKVSDQNQQFQQVKTHYLENADDTSAITLNTHIDQMQFDTNAQLDGARQSLIQSNNDTNSLLLCHIIVSTILNLAHWQSIRRTTDAYEKINYGGKSYYVPRRISNLLDLIKSDRYIGWCDTPEIARELLGALQSDAERHVSNPDLESFLSFIRTPKNMAAPQRTEDLQPIADNMESLSSKNLLFIEIVKPVQLGMIRRIPSFWETHPVLKKTLIGLAIGFSIVAIAAIVVGAMAATFGLAAIAAAVGGTAAAIGLAASMSTIIVGASTALGFAAGKMEEKRKLSARSANEYDDLFEPESSYSTTLSPLISPRTPTTSFDDTLNFESRPSEHQDSDFEETFAPHSAIVNDSQHHDYSQIDFKI